MFERPKSGQRVVLVHIDFYDSQSQEDLSEFKELAASAGAETVGIITGMRSAPDPKYFVGSGKADEVRALVMLEQAELIIFNHALSPSQERNIEQLTKCRVLDRTGLILDIFAQRARTHEGKLQVELAQLQHLATRLVRGWTHLERQKGGIGLRGPGETQLETDRRLLRERIKSINKRLAKVRSQREQSRRARRRAEMPTVSLVGYTNAGKSTLFNRLSGENIYAADKLFATLDPTLRRIELPGAGSIIIADTVGFIRHLPHDLVEAFRATLEETRDANLLLHVIDVGNENRRDNIEQVNLVLEEIAATTVPQLQVFNKIDTTPKIEPHIARNDEGKPTQVWVSAQTGDGIDLLLKAITELLYGDPIYRSLCLSPREGKLRAQLYALDAVLNERIDDEGNWWLSVCLARDDYERLIGPVQISESAKNQ